MRGSEKLLAGLFLIVPLLVAGVGWPAFVRWMGVTGPAPQPEAPGAAATSVATAQAVRTPRPPAPGLPPTPVATGAGATATPAAVGAGATSTPVATGAGATPAPAAVAAGATPAPAAVSAGATPTPAAAGAGSAPTPVPTATPNTSVQASSRVEPASTATDPGATVASFYQLVSAHQFGPAAQLWSPHMRSAYPPGENINQRFSQTQQVAVNRAQVVAMDRSQATVAVDLVEVTPGSRHHYTGTWSLVHADAGWLLDQPNLQQAP